MNRGFDSIAEAMLKRSGVTGTGQASREKRLRVPLAYITWYPTNVEFPIELTEALSGSSSKHNGEDICELFPDVETVTTVVVAVSTVTVSVLVLVTSGNVVVLVLVVVIASNVIVVVLVLVLLTAPVRA